MNTDADELEREIEIGRARLDAAVSLLQGRLHSTAIADELIGIGRRSETGGDIYDLALDAVRRNPMPVLLVCAGVALLLPPAERGVGSSTPAPSTAPRRGSGMLQRRRVARLYSSRS